MDCILMILMILMRCLSVGHSWAIHGFWPWQVLADPSVVPTMTMPQMLKESCRWNHNEHQRTIESSRYHKQLKIKPSAGHEIWKRNGFEDDKDRAGILGRALKRKNEPL